MNHDIQRAKAEAFRAMHDRSRIFVLPNAWDPMSARVIEEAGDRAIAATSAGVAFSVGYPDGEAMARDEMIAAIARIARVVTVPVSAESSPALRTTRAKWRKLFAALSKPARSESIWKMQSTAAVRHRSTIWRSQWSVCEQRARRRARVTFPL